ncbi:MAG: DUF4173 domain-containing protein [Paracoccaceae bacterium]
MTEFVVRGVPRSLRRDGWWLSPAIAGAGGDGPGGGRAGSGGMARGSLNPLALPLLATLVTLADFLFWHHAAGLSVALFALALMLSVRVLTDRRDEPLAMQAATFAPFIASLLPAVETVQLLSVAFLALGTLGATARFILGRGLARRIAPAMLRFAALLPWYSGAELGRLFGRAASVTGWRAYAAGWAMPIVIGSIFLWLLTMANPVAEGWLDDLSGAILSLDILSTRILFWSVAAWFLWPFLASGPIRARLAAPFARGLRSLLAGDRPSPAARPLGGLGFNPGSVSRALVLFNLIFAVQTVLDLRYLWSGAALPDGLTHAAYAHRGAYPLVATALLAGLFALACRPFTQGRPAIRALLFAWVGQNVALVVSSLYRLDLYVDSYGLTHLRVAAAIWMGLVAAGLVSVIWQIWRGRDNLWLLKTNGILLAATLYAASFVNFADMIARHNLDRFVETRGTIATDWHYICTLGPDAAGAWRRFELETGQHPCAGDMWATAPAIEGWRDWGFRSWRVRRYLETSATSPEHGGNARENPRR